MTNNGYNCSETGGMKYVGYLMWDNQSGVS